MKYYSEVTKKIYNSVKELEKVEKEIEEKDNARKTDAARVEEAAKKLAAARKEYSEALSSFCSKHGPYHTTIKSDDSDESAFANLRTLINLLEL